MLRSSQIELQTHGVRKYPTSALLKSSADRGWSAISAELRSHDVTETPMIVSTHTELCFTARGNEDCVMTRTGAGQVTPVLGTRGREDGHCAISDTGSDRWT